MSDLSFRSEDLLPNVVKTFSECVIKNFGLRDSEPTRAEFEKAYHEMLGLFHFLRLAHATYAEHLMMYRLSEMKRALDTENGIEQYCYVCRTAVKNGTVD